MRANADGVYLFTLLLTGVRGHFWLFKVLLLQSTRLLCNLARFRLLLRIIPMKFSVLVVIGTAWWWIVFFTWLDWGRDLQRLQAGCKRLILSSTSSAFTWPLLNHILLRNVPLARRLLDDHWSSKRSLNSWSELFPFSVCVEVIYASNSIRAAWKAVIFSSSNRNFFLSFSKRANIKRRMSSAPLSGKSACSPIGLVVTTGEVTAS